MYKIVKKRALANNIVLMDIEAPRVAKHCYPGQFVIVKMDEKGERIPLTVCDYNREQGTVTIVFKQLVHLQLRWHSMKKDSVSVIL